MADSDDDAESPGRSDAAQVDGTKRSPDAPIRGEGEDRLRRAPFAQAIADDVRHAPRENGFVIGLTGRWGEGKTSVINLVTDELEGDAIVVHFNPWLFSGTEQLVEHFFEELAGQLREKGPERLKQIAGALDAYGRTVAPLTLLPWIGGIVRSSQDVANKLSGALTTEQPSARSRAGELREKLSGLDQPVVVVVDDLDRLRPDEVVDVMRLVRLVGDFPNLVYILAFDRRRVEQALGDGKSERGRAYLEKMVQVIHWLPVTDPKDLSDLFLEELDKTVGDLASYQYSEEHFTNLYTLGIRGLVTTVRDVRRYTNLLPTTLRLVGDEIELADVLALEAFRLFLPESFDRLVEAREALTKTHNIGMGSDFEREKHERQVKAIVEAAGERSGPAEELIRRLFPASSRFFGGSNYGDDWLQSWRRERRVAHPTVLTTYLQRRLSPDELEARSVDAVVAALDDGQRLDELLEDFDGEQLERLLVRIQHQERDYPGSKREVTISVLLNHGRKLPHGRRAMFDFGAGVELSRVVYGLLRDLDPDEVERIVDAIDYPDLSSHYEVVGIVGHREGSGHKFVPEAVAERLEAEVADLLLAASADDMAHERDIGLLIGFGMSRCEEEMRTRVREWSDHDEFFAHLLHGHLAVSLGSTAGDAAVRRYVVLNWPAVIHLVTQDYAARRVKELGDALFEDEFGDDAATVREQALAYADDPAKAETAMQRFRTGDEDDQGQRSVGSDG